MKYDYHIIVIGAGSGGLVVASGAAGLGAKVALIEGDKMGGDCLNYGCVPSKTLIRSARVADVIHSGKDYGVDSCDIEVNMEKVTKRVAGVIKSIEPHDSKERYEGLGVKVYEGYGRFVDRHHIAVGDEIISGRHIVVATGSEPVVPPIHGIDTVPYYTNKTIFDIDILPKRLIVLGAGPIGSELGQAFAHLGSEVTMVDMVTSLFGKDDPEVGPLMTQRFMLDGIALELGAKIVSVNKGVRSSDQEDVIEVVIERDGNKKTITGAALLIALGRKPNTEHLDIQNAGIELGDEGHIVTNERLQTNVKHIYACGDVTGPYAFTHTAGYQAGVIIQNAIFPVKAKVDYRKVPWVTYTKPEVAHVGYTETTLKAKGILYRKYLEPISGNDRAKAEGDMEGFLKILTDRKGVVIGATMVGEKAGELIGLANMAVVKRMKISAFMSMIYPYPTELEIYKSVALTALKEGFKPWQKKLVKKLFLS